MAALTKFDGFPKQCISFYKGLARNNDRDWFEKNKPKYQQHVLGPASLFIADLGAMLQKLSPGITADPRTNGQGSVFRIYRDVRFSRDKSPYKTHLGILFWEGPLKKKENPGLYFHLDGKQLGIYCGLHIFTRPSLVEFRDSVVHDEHGAQLGKIIAGLEKQGYAIGGEHYKKPPRGYDPAHPNAALLLHCGLYFGETTAIPPEVYSRDLLKHCAKRFKDMLPLHRWLAGMVERSV